MGNSAASRAVRAGLFCAILAIGATSGSAAVRALEGGALARAADPLARASVSVQAIGPVNDGKVRVRECTGVLVAPDLVLTAGHCLEEVTGPDRVGVFFFKGSTPVPTIVPVRALAWHPAYRRGWENEIGEAEERQREIAADMALLRLAVPAPDGRKPVALSTDPSEGEGMKAIMVAAGLSGAGPKARSGTLRTATLAKLRFTPDLPRIGFASATGARACIGDSGAPVAIVERGEARILGVVSAVLRPASGCGTRIVVAPVSVDALAAMIAKVGGRLRTSALN